MRKGRVVEGNHQFRASRYVQTHPIPIKGYKGIQCFLPARSAPHVCWQICGLRCARVCDRFGDVVCEGCPCMEAD